MAKEKDTSNVQTPAPKRYKFLNFEERVNKVDATVQKATIQYSRRAETIADNSTHFFEELVQIRNNFDICDDFVYFFNEVYPKSQSPEMLLHNLEFVVDSIVYHVTVPNSLATKSILHLIAVLSRDMRGELIRYYDKLLSAILSLMDMKEPEKTSDVFQTLILMFRNLNGKDIYDNIAIIRKYYGPLFGSKTDFVRQFACESYCYLLRHMRSTSKKSSSLDSSKSQSKEQVKDQIHELIIVLKAVARKDSISDNMILGVSSLLFESIRSLGNQARHYGIDIYKAFLEIVIGKKSLTKTSTIPTPSFISVWNELQYALAEYIAPTKSQSFLTAIQQAFDESDKDHRIFMLDTLNIWLQYQDGVHIQANSFLFDYSITAVKNTLSMIKQKDDDLYGNLFSFTYSLWLYCRSNKNMKVTLMNKIVAIFVQIINQSELATEAIILKVHEFSTFLFHSFQNCSIGSTLTKSLLQAILTTLCNMNNPTLFIDFALPLLVDCLDELSTEELQSIPSTAMIQPLLLSLSQRFTTNAAISLKEQYLILHIFTSLHYSTPSLLSSCIDELKRYTRVYSCNIGISRLSQKKVNDEEIVVIAELLTLAYQSLSFMSSNEIDSFVSLINELLLLFHSIPLLLSTIAHCYSYLPESYHIEELLIQFLNQYSKHLSNTNHIIRKSWLEFFLTFTQCDYVSGNETTEAPAYIGTTDTFQLLLNAEEQPFNLEGESQRLAILQRVITPAMLHLLNPSMLSALLYFFFGLYSVKWSPLWKFLTTTLESFCRIYPEEVWNCMKYVAFMINGYSDEEGIFFKQSDLQHQQQEDEQLLQDSSSTQLSQPDSNDLTCRYSTRLHFSLLYGILSVKRSFQLSSVEAISYESVDSTLQWISVMTLLSNIASLLFKYNRDYITLFLLFIRDHYYSSTQRDDPFASNYHGNDYIKDEYCCIYPCVSNRESNKRLLVLLKMLVNMKEMIKNCYASNEIEQLVFFLLLRNDSEIQKQCLTITCNYHSKEIKPYMEQLEMMCEDTKYRECITTFFLSKQEGMILNEHRSIVVPVIIHILYGRLVSRTNSTRLPLAVRHSSILTYLSSLENEELKEFVYITTFGFYQSIDFPAPTNQEEVKQYVDILDKREGISFSRMTGVLNLLYDIVKYLGMKINDWIHIYLLIECYCMKRVIQDSTVDDKEEDDEENEEQENEDEENEENEKQSSSSQAEIIRKTRSLCLKRLIQLIGSYSYIDYRIYQDYFFTPLTPLLQILPQSTIHAAKTPSLVHLAYVISCNSYLYYIFSLQPYLLPQTLACFTIAFHSQKNTTAKEKGYIGSISVATSTEIVQTIENLLAIDPERDYFNEKVNKKKKGKSKNWKNEKEDLDVVSQQVALTSGMEIEESEKEKGLPLVIPNIEHILNGIEYLLTAIQTSKSNLFNRLLSILYHISQLASESKLTLPSDCLQRLFLLLISFLRYSGNHDNVFDFYKRLIEAICSLIPFVTDYHEGIKQLCLLLYPNKYCIKEVVIRRKLLQCFETMLSQITGFEQTLPLLQNLHSTSNTSIGSYSFAKIGDVYDILIKEGLYSYSSSLYSFLPLYSCILYQVIDEDMMIRTTSMQCIQSFIQAIPVEYLMKGHSEYEKYHYLIQLSITCCKYILKNTNNDNIRRPVITLLRLIAIQFKSLQLSAYNYDLLPLINEENEDEDILLCLINIQTRTRIQGLRALVQLVKQIRDGEKPRLSANSIRNILLPLLFAYIREYDKTSDSLIREECAVTMGFLSELLNWGHYMTLFRKVYNSIYSHHVSSSSSKNTAENDTYIKLYIRILCLITEHFNFAIQDISQFDDVITEKMALTAQDSLSAKALKQIKNLKRPSKDGKKEEEMNVEQDIERVLEEEKEKEKEEDFSMKPTAEISIEEKKKILRLVLTVVIPDLRQLMVQVDERKNQLVRSAVSLAIIQLLLKLPQQLFDIYLPGVTQIVVLCLKQKMQGNRDEARKTLISILKLLGVKYLYLILSQMKSALTEGNQLFILSYTVADMVKAIVPSAQCPVEQQLEVTSIQQPSSITAESLDTIKYPILQNLPLIHQIIIYDLFEDGARSREAEELKAASKANYHELMNCRSYETWETVSSIIPFLPNTAIHFWMAPLFQRIVNCENYSHLQILRNLLKSTVNGLLKNSSIQKTTLLAYCISLMKDAENEIESLKKDVKEIQKSTRIWMTGDINQRITSDGRSQLLVEPEQKLTGDNLSESRRKKVNKTGKTELMGFGFQILNKAMSESFYTMSEDKGLFELIIEHILFVLRCCRNNDVINDCLSLTNTLLAWRLDAFTTNIDALRELLFSMLADFNTATPELTRSLFHTITVIYRQFPKTAMSDKQARALIMLIKRDLNLPEKQNAAFAIVRVILDRKIMISEVYDLMDELSVLLLQSFNDSVRNQCSRVLLSFLLNYPMSNNRVEKLLAFLLKNLDYEEPSGRLALLHLLQNMLGSFPIEYLNSVSDMFFVPLILRFMKETDKFCKAVLQEAIKKEAGRIDVQQYKKLFNFCFKWLQSNDTLIKRTGLMGCVFLIQGRGQIVKGGLDVLFGLSSLLPTSVSELKQMENPSIQQEVENTMATEDADDSMGITVGDEYCSATDEFSLFILPFSSKNPAVDWICYLYLLTECYTQFSEPFHQQLRVNSALLSNISLLLLSEHIFVRYSAVTFLHHFITTEVTSFSLCDNSWLQLPGSVFYLLQRIFISYHLPYSLQSLEETTNCLITLILLYSDKNVSIPAPEGLFNKQLRVLGETKDSNVLKRMKNVEEIRSLYNLDDLVDTDEEEEEEEEESDKEMKEEKEEMDVEKEEEEEEESDKEKEEEKVNKPTTRILHTLRRVPNPHHISDCLYLIGSTLSLNDLAIKKEMLRCFEWICGYYSAEEIEANIIPLLRPLMKVINNGNEKEQELVQQATLIIQQSIEGKLDKTVYIKYYSQIQDDIGQKKNEKKMQVKQLAVLNPKKFIERKRKKAMNAKESKRRKKMIQKGQIRID